MKKIILASLLVMLCVPGISLSQNEKTKNQQPTNLTKEFTSILSLTSVVFSSILSYKALNATLTRTGYHIIDLLNKKNVAKELGSLLNVDTMLAINMIATISINFFLLNSILNNKQNEISTSDLDLTEQSAQFPFSRVIISSCTMIFLIIPMTFKILLNINSMKDIENIAPLAELCAVGSSLILYFIANKK